MTGRQQIRLTLNRISVGVVVGLGAWLLPATAFAQPAVPTLPPGEPPPPGQPVMVADDGQAPPPAPPPAGPPQVPQIQNPVYGTGDGPLGFLRDAWNQVKNPFGTPDGMPPVAPAPPGAGPAPPLPPGYTSITAPESSTPAAAPGTEGGGPPLPEGYYPITGPEPPGWYDNPPPAPMPAAGPLG
ncbi:hypothetical protein [Mycolicibacterium phlei]